MYFVVIGKTPGLSLIELESLDPIWLTRRWSLVCFDVEDETIFQERMALLWGSIKRWKVYPSLEPLLKSLQEAKIIAVNTRELGMTLKKQHGIKRFKEVDLTGANLEVKKEGIEIIDLWDGSIGLVQGRQHIDRSAAIDFDKPVRGMQIGMMPAKLTQILVTIWVHLTWKQVSDGVTIYDPFCGFGTTWFVANSLWYHYMWSDINITPAKQNQKRRLSTPYAHDDRHMTLFKHDVLDPFTKPFLQHVDVIVTEWRLGPVIKKAQRWHTLAQQDAMMENIEKIVHVYKGFLENAKDVFVGKPLVMTIPVYHTRGDVIEQRITGYARDFWYIVEGVGEIYKRKWQVVGRRVLTMQRDI